MRHHEFMTEDELFEINMSPKNLNKLTKELPGALVGLEFEMIVPNAGYEGDDYDEDPENDYDYDERINSFRDVEQFFRGGDGNNHRRDIMNFIEALQERYYDWAHEKQYETWNDEGFDYFKEYIEDQFDEDDANDVAREEVAKENPDMDPDSEEFASFVEARVEELKENWFQEQWDDRGDNFHAAEESWREGQDLPDEDDWFYDQGYRHMSDLENEAHNHDVYWPYQSYPERDQVEDISEVAKEFGEAVGREVKYAGRYHGVSGKDREGQMSGGYYILEPDSSLDPNESNKEAGLEFISPPLPVDEMKRQVKLVADWARTRGAYTGSTNSTGLHMNVSIPGFSKDKLDYVKLAILLGDNHVLKEFDRIGNSYAKGSFGLLEKSLQSNPSKVEAALEKMKSHFDMAASKAINSGNTEKYTSINVKDNRVEFRGPGGDYLSLFEKNPDKLLAPMMRFVVALDAACDPEKYRKEYQKKLYKLLGSTVKKDDALELFTRYAAGKGMPESAYKSFLNQRRNSRYLDKEIANEKGDWNVYSSNELGGKHMKLGGVPMVFRDMTYSDAKKQLELIAQNYGTTTTNMELRKAEPTKSESGKWGVMIKDQNAFASEYQGPVFAFNTEEEARNYMNNHSWRGGTENVEVQPIPLSALQQQPEQPQQQAQPDAGDKYELYRISNGQAVEHQGEPIRFNATDPDDAERKIERIASDFNLGAPQLFAVRSVLNVPPHTVRSSQPQTQYEMFDRNTREVISVFSAPSDEDALNTWRQYLRDHQLSADNYGVRVTSQQQQAQQQQAQQQPAQQQDTQATDAQGVPVWEIRDVRTNQVVNRFASAGSSSERSSLALTWLRDNGYENPVFNFRVWAAFN